MANAPYTFFMFMNEAFKSLIKKRVVVYPEDIIVYSRTKKDHWKDLKSVINLLKMNQIVAEAIKYKFMEQELVFLGYVVSKDGIKPNH